MSPTLQTVASLIAQRAGRPLPLSPYTVAVALGLVLLQRPGALYALREDGRVFLDSRWTRTEREAMVARACAVYVLQRAGLLRTSSHDDIAWLTRVLCGVDLGAVCEASGPGLVAVGALGSAVERESA